MPEVTYNTNAPKYMAAFRESMQGFDFNDAETEATYKDITDPSSYENFGSESVAYMRMHLVLLDMHPIIALLKNLGSESPFITMYERFGEVQKDITTEELNAILVEAKAHAGIEEDTNA